MGRDTEQEKRLGDRTKWFQEAISDREAESPWDKVQLKKGAVACVKPQIPEIMTGTDIEKKWEDFEKIPVGDMWSFSLIGSEASQGTNQALQTEVFKCNVSDQVTDLFPHAHIFYLSLLPVFLGYILVLNF